MNVSAGSSSGVVGGLMTGEQYQFSVSITVPGNGRTYTGPVSDPIPFTVVEPPTPQPAGGEYQTFNLSIHANTKFVKILFVTDIIAL